MNQTFFFIYIFVFSELTLFQSDRYVTGQTTPISGNYSTTTDDGITIATGTPAMPAEEANVSDSKIYVL